MEHLKLENQICFPFYALSRLIIRAYQPQLDALGITYPQYLVMLVLWEKDGLSVNQISEKLILNTNTITPLLKRMEQMGLLKRVKSKADERKVLISLSPKGKDMQQAASCIPEALLANVTGENISLDDLNVMKGQVNQLLERMK